MKIALAPLNIKAASPEANLAAAESAATQAAEAGARLLALPEMFSTGYTADAAEIRRFAEPDDGPTMTALRRLATDRDIAITGSIIGIAANGGALNRSFFIKPGGDTTYYNKYHLFTHSGENTRYERGNGYPVIVEWEGWRIRMAVCYDLRFPAWLRNGDGEAAYDMLLVPANWPAARGVAFTTLLAARAIENQCIAVGCNRRGTDPWGDYPAELSLAFDYKGRQIAEPLNQGSDLLIAEPNLESLKHFRERFPVQADADPFTLSLR